MGALSELYDARQRLVDTFITLARQSEDEKADQVFEMIMNVEEEISRTPAQTLEDVTMKLLFLRDCFEDYMSDCHREAFDDVINLINLYEAEQASHP